MGESYIDRVRKSKSYWASLRKFQNRLYFNKKFREDFFNTLVESRDEIVEIVEKTRQPKTLQEAQANLVNEEFVDRFTNFADTRKEVENYLKNDVVTDGRFRLYRRRREAIFTSTYRKGGKRKLRKAYLYLKGGIPGKARKKGILVREKDFPLDGFGEVDNGDMIQTRRTFEHVILKYIGRNKYKFRIYLRGLNPENLWVERINR